MSEKKRVLIIEDDRDIAKLVTLHLEDTDMLVDHAADGQHGLQLSMANTYDLILLDLMLPLIDGLEVCKQIRASGNSVPVLMLTSKSEEIDKVLGLEIGADDYLTKPFSIRELIARVKALIRRVNMDKGKDGEDANQPIAIGDLNISPERRTVLLSGNNIELTTKEFDLLYLFATHPGKAYSRQDLLDQVWGYQYAGYSHTVNSHINRLRGKIESDPANPEYIKTVWGMGYKFIEASEISA